MKKRLFLILFLVFICGCATLGSVPGNTRADGVLQSDIIHTIGFYEKSQGGSYTPKVINTTAIVSNDTSVKERWTVDRKGKEVNYIVTLTPDPKGGTKIYVTLEK